VLRSVLTGGNVFYVDTEEDLKKSRLCSS